MRFSIQHRTLPSAATPFDPPPPTQHADTTRRPSPLVTVLDGGVPNGALPPPRHRRPAYCMHVPLLCPHTNSPVTLGTLTKNPLRPH